MPAKTEGKKLDNDRWIRDNFGLIVKKYGGRVPYVLVASGKVFPVKPKDNIRDVEERIRKRFGKTTGLPVPRPKDFPFVLPARRNK